ncbi:helix-turn-helix domain-containing protein [Qipengyuania sp. DSG2-2]|uniref:helix-turn-helix domain-containing protein n=1 Tax=Qipengyuania sp. DGS2-2 TaxID=3349631 RepID=UPI0036D3AD48
MAQKEPPFEFGFAAMPPALRGYANAFYTFKSGAGKLHDIMPSYSPQLMLFSKGGVFMDFPDGRHGPISGPFFVTQLDEAVPFIVDGPADMIGVSLNMRGWAALTGLPVNETSHRPMTVDSALSPFSAARINELVDVMREGTADTAYVARSLGNHLAEALRPLPADHDRFIADMLEWLGGSFSPSLEDLQDTLAMSPRTVQRLSNRYFGRPPVTLAKRYRAIRAATYLTSPDLPKELETEILDAYYDQAHLIRDLRKYTGRTPSRFTEDGTGSLAERTLDVKGYGNGALFTGLISAEAANG